MVHYGVRRFVRSTLVPFYRDGLGEAGVASSVDNGVDNVEVASEIRSGHVGHEDQ